MSQDDLVPTVYPMSNGFMASAQAGVLGCGWHEPLGSEFTGSDPGVGVEALADAVDIVIAPLECSSFEGLGECWGVLGAGAHTVKFSFRQVPGESAAVRAAVEPIVADIVAKVAAAQTRPPWTAPADSARLTDCGQMDGSGTLAVHLGASVLQLKPPGSFETSREFLFLVPRLGGLKICSWGGDFAKPGGMGGSMDLVAGSAWAWPEVELTGPGSTESIDVPGADDALILCNGQSCSAAVLVRRSIMTASWTVVPGGSSDARTALTNALAFWVASLAG